MRLMAALALSAMGLPGLALAATPTAALAAPLDPVEYVTGRIPASVAPISLAEALDRIRTQSGLPDLVSLAVGAPQEPANPGTGLPWLDIAMRTPSVGDGGEMAALWESDLLMGAVADLIATGPSHWDTLSGATLTELLPGGGRASAPETAGAIVSRQLFADDPPEAIERRIADAAASFGLEVVSTRVVHALTAAPMVVLRTSDPNVLRRLPEITGALFGDFPPAYEGHYLEIQNQSGHPLVRLAASFRTGAGRTWNDPSVTDVANIIHGGVPSVPNASIPSNLLVGVGGLRWRASGGRLTGLVAGVRLSGAGTVNVTASARGRVLARGRIAFGRRGTRRVSLHLIGGPLSARSSMRSARLQLRVVGRDTSHRSLFLTQTLVPAR
jgi:hypothetical protein